MQALVLVLVYLTTDLDLLCSSAIGNVLYLPLLAGEQYIAVPPARSPPFSYGREQNLE